MVCFQVDTHYTKEDLFGPYCGKRPEWTIVSLWNKMRILYIGSEQSQALFTIVYEIIPKSYSYYNDRPTVIAQEHFSKPGAAINFLRYQPTVVTGTHSVYEFHIKVSHIENIEFDLASLRFTPGEVTEVYVYEGPSSFDPHLLLWQLPRQQTMNSPNPIVTKTHQGFVLIKLVKSVVHHHKSLFILE